MSEPFQAYEGAENYAFVSYSHKDQDDVFAEIRWLQGRSVNIWYDQGISAGTEWSDAIAQAIKGASLLIYFVSPNSVRSENCRRELNFAMEEGISVLPVYLEETIVPDGLRLNLNNRQALFRYANPDYRTEILQVVSGMGSPAEDRASREVRQSTRPAQNSTPKSPFKKSSIAALTLLFVLGVTGAWWWIESAPTESVAIDSSGLTSSGAEILETAIAVMPFTGLDLTSQGESFAQGVRADVMSHLFRIGEIVVISASAVEKHAGARPRDVSRDLLVSHVLDGRVQVAGNAVRVSVELIDGPTERQIWSHQYDKNLEDLFGIQSEIATSVANQLSVKLSDELVNTISTVPTTSMAAFRLVRQARTTSDPERKIALLEEAITLDPEYVEPHRELSATLRSSTANFFSVRDRVTKHAEEAVRLGPEDAAAHIELGDVSMISGRFADAIMRTQRAIELAPNNNLYASRLAVFYSATGRDMESVPLFEGMARRCGNVLVHPLRKWFAGDYDGYRAGIQGQIDSILASPTSLRQCVIDSKSKSKEVRAWELADRYQNIDDYVRRIELLYAARALRKPVWAPNLDAPVWLAKTFSKLGDYEATDRWYDYLEGDSADSRILFPRMRSFQERRDPEAMGAYLSRWTQESATEGQVLASEQTLKLMRVLATHDKDKRRRLRKELYENMPNPPEFATLDVARTWLNRTHNTVALIALAYQYKEFRPEQSKHLARALIDYYARGALSTIDGERVIGERHANLVYAYALLGDVDKAIEEYREAERYSWRTRLSWGVFDDDEGYYHGLAQHPEFIAIDERIRAKNARDIARIKAELPYTRDPLARPLDPL